MMSRDSLKGNSVMSRDSSIREPMLYYIVNIHSNGCGPVLY